MKTLIFDSSSIISLAMNNLLWILKPLKEKFDGEFLISNDVKKELIDNPLQSKKFKLEAINVLNLVREGILKVQKENPKKVGEIFNIVNSIYSTDNKTIGILHKGEIGALVEAMELDSAGIVIDERTTRLLIEDPYKLHEILEKKLHTTININKKVLSKFTEITKNVKVIRSTELAIISYEMKLFENYTQIKSIKNIKEELLDGILWGLKLRGCSISDDEIKEIIRIEK